MFNIKPKSKDERLTILILIEYQDCTIYNSYMKMAAQASKSRKSSFLTPNLTLFILRARSTNIQVEEFDCTTLTLLD